MAESLEGNRDMDCDKKMDSLGYLREQVSLFHILCFIWNVSNPFSQMIFFEY